MAKVFCALFHDKEDSSDFGKLLASQILAGRAVSNSYQSLTVSFTAFVEEYSGDLNSMGHNLKDFHDFHFKISEVIRHSVRPILAKLQQHRGIQLALLVNDDSTTHATAEVDQLAVLANLQALLSVTTDMMASVEDAPVHIWMEVPCSLMLCVSTVLVRRRIVVPIYFVYCMVFSQASRTTRILVWRLNVERATLVVQCNRAASSSKCLTAIAEAVHLLSKVCLLTSSLHQALG